MTDVPPHESVTGTAPFSQDDRLYDAFASLNVSAGRQGNAVSSSLISLTEQTRVNDIEKWYSELMFQYDNLYWKFEVEKIKHTIAERYYGFRAFWFIFLPVLILTMAITVLGFLSVGDSEIAEAITEGNITATGDLVNSMRQSGFFETISFDTAEQRSILVGSLGVISTALHSLGKYTNYQSNTDMQKVARSALENICKNIQSGRERVVSHKRNWKCGGKKAVEITEEVDTELKVRVETYHSKLRVTQENCDSLMPVQIEQSFNKLEELFQKHFNLETEDGMMSWRKHYRAAYTDLWKRHTTWSLCLNGLPFPLFLRDLRMDDKLMENYYVGIQSKI